MSDRGPWRPGALCQLPKWLMALDVGPDPSYTRLMTKDNAYAFAQFSAILKMFCPFSTR